MELLTSSFTSHASFHHVKLAHHFPARSPSSSRVKTESLIYDPPSPSTTSLTSYHLPPPSSTHMCDMSVLPQQWHSLTLKRLASTSSSHHRPHSAGSIIATLTSTTRSPPRHNLMSTTLAPPVTPQDAVTKANTRPSYHQPHPREIDPSLISTWGHRAWVASGCTTVLFSIVKSVAVSHSLVEPLLAGLGGYVMADLGTGIYHWGIDNYGGPETPVFGAQIEAFQGHHKWPWTITRRQFTNNLHALARAVTFVVLPAELLLDDAAALAFVGVFSGCIMFSQQFHAWAHGTKSRLPPLVVALQDMGLLISRAKHGAHHRPPYDNNYCIVSGMWNELLDKYRVFETMEMVLFFKLGIRPRSWGEPDSNWAEEVEELLPS